MKVLVDEEKLVYACKAWGACFKWNGSCLCGEIERRDTGRPLIVAGSHEQAQSFAEAIGLSLAEWVYVTKDTICGRRARVCYLVGTYYEREDWPTLQDALIPTGAALVAVRDISTR